MTDEIVTLDGSTPTIQQAIDRYNLIVEYTKRMMKEGKDYGTIPGTGKPTLYKPGAEKLCSLFGLYPEFLVVDSITDFDKGLFYFNYKCILSLNGKPVASGDGSCNSKEKKYRYRNVYENKATEQEKQNALRVETKEGKYGKYKVYVIENTEPFELVNTLSKMAQKRALVAATLIAANASEFFTQDLEDLDIIEGDFQEVEASQKKPPVKKPAPKKPAPKKAPTNGDHPGKVVGKEDEPNTAPPTNGKRPFNPDVVKIKIGEAVVDYLAKGWTAKDTDRNMIVPNMEMCFAGDPNSTANRKAVMQYLVGKTSVKDLNDAEVIAFKKWLNAKPDNGGEWHPDPKTVQEVIQINTVALKAEGQQELIPSE